MVQELQIGGIRLCRVASLMPAKTPADVTYSRAPDMRAVRCLKGLFPYAIGNGPVRCR